MMNQIEVTLNGKRIQTERGITILELARRQGISIPTLCHDEELKPYGSCWVCAVEVTGRRGFVTSCGTMISDGMEIRTDSDEIRNARKMALELLISNHYADCEAPCKIACPDHVDIQSYVSLIANGQYHEAVKVIKDTLPMPLSIGRVCPAFCEKECRRQIVEEPIAIRQLKRFCADQDLNDFWQYIPERLPAKGKRIAIIGAGPSGLCCGYYLSNSGYDVCLFEANPQAGGWLRYGIPEYRLPKAILDKEIELMCLSGMKIEYNMVLGRNITLGNLSKEYDAIYLAIGAQKAVPMPVKGSDLQGCYLGVDFLKAHTLGNTPRIGKRVAVVGGGNTAIDCARTAVRLGAQVSIIYRRTKDEMPADSFEIEAAEHEGVIFHYLSNPVEYHGEKEKLCRIKIEKMRLGEPDNSGRRRPEPTGEFFTEDFDAVIAAISQVPEVDLFAGEENMIGDKTLPLSRWQTAIVDEATMYSGMANVFAGGDFRRGAATAIEAIADGRIAAQMIDKYLMGEKICPDTPLFDAKKGKKIQDINPEEYEIFESKARVQMPELELARARRSFEEVELGFEEKTAQAEAERCLECGCQVNDSCMLRKYSTEYSVDPIRFLGSINRHPIDYSHPFIVRDANKCINCGRCIRTCAEIQGAAVLGYIYRGFPTLVAPEFGNSLGDTNCESCGKCINVCPVGALTERNLNYKLNPLPKESIVQNCGLCGTGCVIKLEVQTTEIARITTPDEDENPGFNGRNICFKGRFGWQALSHSERLTEPMKRTARGWKHISWVEASLLIKENFGEARSKRFEISPYISLEEMLMLKSAANASSAKFSAGRYQAMFTDSLLDLKPAKTPYPQLEGYSEYVVVGEISHTLRTLLRLRQRKGKKLILVDPPESGFSRFADQIVSNISNLEASSEQLFIYNQNHLSEYDVFRLWKKAASVDPSCKNILPGSDYPNLLGMLSLKPDLHLSAGVDFALAYGAVPVKTEQVKYRVAVLHFHEPNADVDLQLPLPSYQDIEGHALANAGIVSTYKNPRKSKLINELMKLFYEQRWIHPNTAEINYWASAAEALVKQMETYEPQSFDARKIDPDKLCKDMHPALSNLNFKMGELYLLRQEQSKF